MRAMVALPSAPGGMMRVGRTLATTSRSTERMKAQAMHVALAFSSRLVPLPNELVPTLSLMMAMEAAKERPPDQYAKVAPNFNWLP